MRVPAVDYASMATTVDLTTLAGAIESDAELDAWRPVIGGKSAGFVALINTPGLPTPPTPLAVTSLPRPTHSGDLERDAL